MRSTLRKSGYGILDFDIVRGDGCYIFDERGKKYLDFESGVWCSALGHNNEKINNAIKNQLDRISHTGYVFRNDFANEASETLLDILGMQGGKCGFLSSGTEAVELSVQIGRAVRKEKLTLVLSDQYFGSYGSARKKDPEEFYTFDYTKCMLCNKSADCDASCPEFEKIPFEAIETFLFEPGGKGGLALFPPQGLVKQISRKISERNGYVIINEVTTGLGRTGKWFGYQHYELCPDIVAVGKILGNGYPVSAAALTSKVSEELDKVDFHYAQSHSNDPLGCTVAKEVLSVLKKENLIESSHETGAFFLNNLKKLSEEIPEIKEVRGRGMTICIEFCDSFSENHLNGLYRRMVERGYIVGIIKRFNSIRFMPPFILTEAEIMGFIKNFREILCSL